MDKLTEQEHELLAQARLVAETVETKGWKEVIVPFLLTVAEWPDPKSYSDREEIILPYTEAYGQAEAVRKLHQFVDNQIDMMKNLAKKAEGKDVISGYEI